MVHVVVLSANGETRTLKSTAATVTGATVAKMLRKTKAPELIGSYTWKSKTLQVWGWKEGKAGTENKHELPPPHDELLLFGDAVVSMGGDFNVELWDSFYNDAFGGFEDIGSEDDAAAEEEEEEEDVEDEDDVAAEDAEDAEEADEADEADAEEEDEDDAAEEDDIDDDCYDDGDEAGGGGKRRAPRRRTAQTPEYRRIDMGLRARIKLPSVVGKRAPKWQTEHELQEETY